MENRDSKWKRLYFIIVFVVAFAGWVGMDYIFEENLTITVGYLARTGIKMLFIFAFVQFVNYRMTQYK